MKASLALSAFLSLAALAPSACAYYTYGLGKSVSVGTAGSGPSIKKVSTTFNPGTPPTGQSGELILYPALSNGMFRSSHSTRFNGLLSHPSHFILML